MTGPLSPDTPIRSARDADGERLVELIASCFAEYPGCMLDVQREAPELRAIATAYERRGGRFWVADRAGALAGCVGVVPAREGDGVELQKLYVAKGSRRRGLGTRLCRLVEAEASARRAAFIELWSDTRFSAAHRLYEGLGYARDGRTRELDDLSHSVELHFRKEAR